MKSLYRKYRPKTWDDLIGQDRLVKAIARLHKRGSLGGRAFWLTGPSGCGKTSAAYLIAADVCDPANFVELDAGDCTPARLEELQKSLGQRLIGCKPGRAILVNECHGLRKDAIRKLLVMLEKIPSEVTWVFTTITAGKQRVLDGMDGNPLLSRCIEFELEGIGNLRAFAERVRDIAESEDLGGAELTDYITLAQECQCNMRQMLQRVEAGEMVREYSEPVDASNYSIEQLLALVK